MKTLRLLPGLIGVLLLLGGFAPPAQAPIIDLSVRAGYDGRFRESDWLPVVVNVSNQGDPMQGRLVIRPETSGVGITNTFSAPVNLPTGATQTVTLYVTARSFATQIRVELIDDGGVIVAAEPAVIAAIQPMDRLYVVVTESAIGSIDMSGAALGTGSAYQTNWRVEDIPDRASALSAMDVLLMTDADTSALSAPQRQALETWLLSGGHLIVTGGGAWQPTAAGLVDLLPLVPEASETLSDLDVLATWLRASDADLTGDTVVATGRLHEDARVLVEREGLPLLARRAFGSGTVDYLSVDPNAQPLRGWDGMTSLWVTLQTTVEPRVSWGEGFTNWDLAASATEILPGFNLLPDVLPLCGFLGLYIALIGPLNYLLLARLNRRELAWLTIPALIIVFSGLAYILGFNLRGTEATLSRLSVVRAWSEGDQATVEGLVGLLSPRRAQYALTMEDGSALRPIPRVNRGSLLGTNVQSTVDIAQSDVFTASDFAVDASFIAGFSVSGVIDKPAIGGSASVAYDDELGQQRVRGSVRNDSDITLETPVLLARGMAFSFEQALAPGDSAPFDLLLPNNPPPAPLIYTPTSFGLSSYYYTFYGGAAGGQTVTDVLGQDDIPPGVTTDAALEEQRRRRMFLASFITDFYTYTTGNRAGTVSTGRGDDVYLAGWTSTAPLNLSLEGAAWNSEDTTFYLIELEVEHVAPTTTVTITPDQFTWVAEDRLGMGEIAPLNLSLQPGDQATFRFTPLPSAILSTVERLIVRLERTNIGTSGLPVYVYDWLRDEWREVTVDDGVGEIANPAAYLGPENAVLVRVDADAVGGYIRFDRLVVEQQGRF